ncbi:MAG: hypothetical protein V4611_01875 [Patescibacteria group bacterium]
MEQIHTHTETTDSTQEGIEHDADTIDGIEQASLDAEIAEIENYANELGLPPEETAEAIADFVESKSIETGKPQSDPESISEGLDLIANKLEKIDADLGDIGVELGNIGETLTNLVEILMVIEAYVNKIANEEDPEEKVRLAHELQEKINEFGAAY